MAKAVKAISSPLGLFAKPKLPKTDPAVVAAQQKEQARAEAALLSEKQAQLDEETRLDGGTLSTRGLRISGPGLRRVLGGG